MGLEDLHIALFQMTWGGNKVLKNVEIQFAIRSLSVVLYHNDYVSWVTCELYSPYFSLKVTPIFPFPFLFFLKNVFLNKNHN